jgi:metal-dependent hydrolase (beta-lactamase superfamily II)
MHGIDLVLPDFTWLRENADRIEACVATHGHEDHVGGLQFLLREMSFPIYGSQEIHPPLPIRNAQRKGAAGHYTRGSLLHAPGWPVTGAARCAEAG